MFGAKGGGVEGVEVVLMVHVMELRCIHWCELFELCVHSDSWNKLGI